MGFFRDLGRRAERFKRTVESASEATHECADCGALFDEATARCPECESEDVVALD